MQIKKLLFIAIIICLTFQMLYGQYKEFLYGDSVRTYAVYEPSLDPNPDGYPLVIGLHGASSEGYAFIATAGLILKANAEKFIVACPNSLRYNFLTWWNAGGIYEDITGGTDDVGFISALIDTMIEKYNVDTTRVYVMGFSNGAAMAYRVAAELSPKIASMGVSSGQMLYEYCNPEFPVPIIHFHGLNDDKFPYYGSSDSAQAVPSVDTTMAMWRGINNCSSIADTIFNDNDIIGRKWNSSTGLSDIILYTNPEGVHEWPRPANWGISATDLIWDFLKLHTRTISTKIEGDYKLSIPTNFKLYQNYPNPFNPTTMIKYNLPKSSRIILKIYNLAGQAIETLVNEFQPAGEHEVIWQPKGLPSGLYFYKIQAGEYSDMKKLILQK